MREELYISEKELVELSKRNDFLNRLNDEKNQQLLHDAQNQADFTAAMNKIDEQNELTVDEIHYDTHLNICHNMLANLRLFRGKNMRLS